MQRAVTCQECDTQDTQPEPEYFDSPPQTMATGSAPDNVPVHPIDDPDFISLIARGMIDVMTEKQKSGIRKNMERNSGTTLSVGTGCSGSDLYIDGWQAQSLF
jgi:hypothetical protein